VAHRGRRNADEALALAVASGQTLRDAAAATGIGERTATRRCADPAFRRRVAELRGSMVQLALGRMADGMAEAADKPRQLLAADSESVRLGAARALLELGVKLRESVELAERLDALERLVEGLPAAGGAAGPPARPGKPASPTPAGPGLVAAGAFPSLVCETGGIGPG
jgi:hypothetical protein